MSADKRNRLRRRPKIILTTTLLLCDARIAGEIASEIASITKGVKKLSGSLKDSEKQFTVIDDNDDQQGGLKVVGE